MISGTARHVITLKFHSTKHLYKMFLKSNFFKNVLNISKSSVYNSTTARLQQTLFVRVGLYTLY